MKILIDTHVFLWFYLEPQRINQRAHKFLQDTFNLIIKFSFLT